LTRPQAWWKTHPNKYKHICFHGKSASSDLETHFSSLKQRIAEKYAIWPLKWLE
jgi:hypothetical protein